jgi:Ca-activated chloride channel family protein
MPIIEKLPEERTREAGALSVNRAGQRVALPLAGHRIVARAAGCVAEVTVEQSFQNPFQEFLEAVYIFPLGGGAAVSAFEMKVGGRLLKGIVKERGEARLDYQKAIDDGRRAALLEQERDNVFTVQVGNLPPGEDVSVRIVYSERLPYFESGVTELRLPLVVAPRYIPGVPLDGPAAGSGVEFDTDSVADASRISPPRLAPGFDPKVALSVEVELADTAVEDIACSQHAIRLSNGRITLSRADEPLDRDFVLRWRLAKAAIQSRLLVNRGGYAMLSLIPPLREGSSGVARDVVFVLDRSGSMSGVKMASAARACSILLDTLGPRDNFAICAFNTITEWLQWTRADEGGIAAGRKFLSALVADGGTELYPAFDQTFTQITARQETTGRMPAVVLITDGQIGNEAQLLKLVQQDTSSTRVFTVGIDTAVNAAFLQRLAALSGGTCTCCVPGEALDDALASVGREIGAPVVTDLRIDGADLAAPSRTPDLFAGRASASFFVGQNLKNVWVQGIYADGAAFAVTVEAETIDLPAIAHLWARARVADLEDRLRLGENVKQEIIDLAVKHTLLTRLTAFVVVDESETVNKEGARRTVVQPVEMPDRWESQSTFAPVEASLMLALTDSYVALQRLQPGSPLYSATNGRAAAFKVPSASASSGIFRRMRRVFETRKPPTPVQSDNDSFTADKPMSKAQRAMIDKAIAALAQALNDARAMFERGIFPAVKPIEQARQSLMNALAQSGAGMEFAALQKLLRSTLVELVAALSTGSAASVKLIDRAQKEFDAATQPRNFWEAGI